MRLALPGRRGEFRGLLREGSEDDLPPGLLSDPIAARAGGGPGWIVRRYRPKGLHSVVRNSVRVSKERNAFTFALEYEARGIGEKDPARGRRAWLREFARFVRTVHAARIYHRDQNTANVLVPDAFVDPKPGAFVLIDVNRTRFGSPSDPGLAASDLSRLGGSPDERRFILRCYAGDAKEYLRLRGRVLRLRTIHDARKKLNRGLGVKKALVTLKLK